MRLSKLFALFIVFAFIASAVPVHAQTQYYALNFDGEDDYVEVPDSESLNPTSEITIVALFRLHSLPPDRYYPVAKGSQYRFFVDSVGRIYWQLKLNGTWAGNWIKSTSTLTAGETVMVATSYSASTQLAKIYINGQLDASGSPPTVGDIDTGTNPLQLGYKQDKEYFDGKIYLVLIYNRALSDEEIQAIYNDPLNPPTDGLVLWLAPDSVDTQNGLWKDKSGNNNDGTIVGAAAERVSIPRLYVYDANSSALIPYANVSLTLYFNNTTTSLIPSFPVLPYNETVTLNISAVNYESRTISTWTGIDAISVYLEPIANETEIDINQAVNMTELVQNITANLSIEPINPYAKAFLNSGGSFGETIVNAIKGDQLMKLILPQGLIFIITIIVLWQTQSPLAGLGGTIITWAMFLTLLDEKPNLTNSGVTFALVVFLVAWTLWDLFYNYSRET